MPQSSANRPLIRGMGLGSAVLLNILDMIGVGPFVTIPLIIGAMGGPQAMLGWILGAVFAWCGLVPLLCALLSRGTVEGPRPLRRLLRPTARPMLPG